ncbi:protein BONZAI 3-like [Capsicum annuum]|uniref:protein BONZAI 3-like n=1 Tax=Capsicum annuum TaxID=4072 RepID=UPI001FB14010|nr:protein BONZAI 3-like [Capsicum annuum]
MTRPNCKRDIARKVAEKYFMRCRIVRSRCVTISSADEWEDLKLKDQDFLSEVSCVLSELYYGESPVLASDRDYKDLCPSMDIVVEALQVHKGSNNVTKCSRCLTLNLHNRNGHVPKNLGGITVLAEETVTSRTAVEMTLQCTNLENKDLFSKSDPFLRISRITETGGSVPICKTEVDNNNLNPHMKDNPLVIGCFDFNSSGNHVLLGKLQKTVADLENFHKSRVRANFISQPSGLRGNEKVLKGQLLVEGYAEKQLYSFLDYISSEFELSFMTLSLMHLNIQCLASNGNPRSPDSLHYVDPSGCLNAYQRAIMEVGDVIQFYDSDKLFPAWGFGGKAYDGTISHCFNFGGGPVRLSVTLAYNSTKKH